MRWSMLPVSVALHVAAIVFCLVVPFAADLELPAPWPHALRNYVVVSAAPAPVPPPDNRPGQSPTVSEAAPLHSPDRIEANANVDDSDPAPPVEGGLPHAGAVASGVPIGLNVGAQTIVPPPPPQADARPQLFRIGGDIREPRKVIHVPAVYPEIARQARIEGLVIIEATIDERGFVINARVLRSHSLLDAAALTALKQWRYTPTLLNGVPVRVLMTITFNFTLGNQAP